MGREMNHSLNAKLETEHDEIAAKRVCSVCVGEAFLRQAIIADGQTATCSYCTESGATISIAGLAKHVEGAFERHYFRTDDSPSGDEYTLEMWERKGDEAAQLIVLDACVSDEIAGDIVNLLAGEHFDLAEESEFDEEARYVRGSVNSGYWSDQWQRFENGLKYDVRFFNRRAESVLSEIFDGIESLQARSGIEVIARGGPQTNISALYRARVFESDSDLEKALEAPEKELGPAPSTKADAKRMNAQGISVFYGTQNEETALAEVRPPVGSFVAVGRFDFIRPVRLLDIQALQGLEESTATDGSIFDPLYKQRLEHISFLKQLSHKLAKPVVPRDEKSEYLPTQAVADYLAGSDSLSLDGIMFPSVQDGERRNNVVLFHKASCVEPSKYPPKADIRAHLTHSDEDGTRFAPIVFVDVPQEKKEPRVALSSQGAGPLDAFFDCDFDLVFDSANVGESRHPTLKLDVRSIVVHRVQAVKIGTDPYPVDWHD